MNLLPRIKTYSALIRRKAQPSFSITRKWLKGRFFSHSAKKENFFLTLHSHSVNQCEKLAVDKTYIDSIGQSASARDGKLSLAHVFSMYAYVRIKILNNIINYEYPLE